jgi:hypothetical protein
MNVATLISSVLDSVGDVHKGAPDAAGELEIKAA